MTNAEILTIARRIAVRLRREHIDTNRDVTAAIEAGEHDERAQVFAQRILDRLGDRVTVGAVALQVELELRNGATPVSAKARRWKAPS